MSEKVSSVLQKLDQREISDAYLRNTLMDFLDEAQEQKRRELEEKQRELEEKRRLNDHITHLTEQIERLKEATISAPNSTSSSPNHLTLPPTMPFPFLNLSALSPLGSSVYGPQSIGYPPNSPWASSPQYLEARQPSPSPAHSRPTSPAQWNIPALRSLLTRFELIEEVDLQAILENEEQSIPFREKRKADLIVSTKQFRDWMVTNRSSELLVHGEFRRSRSASEPVSALSVFCATLTQTFRNAGQQQIALVFFCGSHVERDDQQRGPGAMICSFIAQLAKLWPFDATKLQDNASVPFSQLHVEAIVKDGNLLKLCELFGRLVQLLPEQTTLICIIDGISHYETDEFEDGLLIILGSLLSLARKGDTAATVKVLAGSPTTTDLVQTRFKDDDSSFISLAEIRDLGQGLGSMQLEMSSDEEVSRNSEESDDTDSE
ncbi:hypothetical protein FJTKL_07461 [Diaporthe vaccinii]|uniref:Nephrocystin 3-like N-terminal domain-containing protein n=1 Tax=Diaporthe vaccinii TaxID=105482 RepID=A0ABR4DP95_9PEZI